MHAHIARRWLLLGPGSRTAVAAGSPIELDDDGGDIVHHAFLLKHPPLVGLFHQLRAADTNTQRQQVALLTIYLTDHIRLLADSVCNNEEYSSTLNRRHGCLCWRQVQLQHYQAE